MKLHWSSRSPFVRKVMVAAHELGLADRLELIRAPVAMSEPNAELMRFNPLSRIPTLVLDDGTLLTDSGLICEYLDMLDGRHRLFPAQSEARIDALRRHALATGFMELSVIRRNELTRPEALRSPDHMASYARKSSATLDVFERDAPGLADKPFDIGALTLAVALAYLDFRFADEVWRDGRPTLARWHEAMAARPSMLATLPVDA